MARMPDGVSRLLTDLHSLRLTERERDELALKVSHLAGVVEDIEYEKRKQEEERAKRT